MSAWTVHGYAEKRQLGQGASGRVVAAVSEATGQRVAIKYLSPALFRDPAFLAEFRYEAELLRSLDIPQVVQLYGYAEAPGQGAAIVMELVDGVSLHQMITRRGATGAESALAVLKGSLLGLAAVHTLGIVHRDYKPENVLVDTAGNSKLSDFGVAVKAGKQAPAAGTPLYMAPEQWAGAAATPATDIYAATAVFFECLTGKTPFSGKPGQLRRQHETAAVPLHQLDEPLQGLIARGMAKDPAYRPASAIAFAAELEATAAAAYGPDWEERGRSQLAERAAALLPLLLRRRVPGTAGISAAASWLTARRTRAAAVIAAATVIAVAATATAITLAAGSTNPKPGDTVSDASTVQPAFTAAVSVTPPVVASSCATPATFTYTGTLTASARGTVSYRWVYSSGQQGPVQTVSFTAAGQRQVPGKIIRTQTAGSDWAAIKIVSPAAPLSDKVSYRLLCGAGHNPEGITATASVHPAAKTVICGTTPPAFTATGSITSHEATTVTYYWALSDGSNSAPATLTFSAPGTMAVHPWTVSPHTDPASGEAVLVVASPAVAASSPAKYTLSCTPPPPLTLSVSAQVSPQSELTDCSTAPPAFTFTGTITANQATTVSYYWKLPTGDGPPQTLSFTGAGTRTVNPDSFTPVTSSHGGSGQIVVTSPKAAASAPATFTLSCHPGKGQITVSLASSPGSSDKVTCGTAPPPFTVTGTISSDQATSVSYGFTRSDGSTGSSGTVSIGSGASIRVTDTVDPPPVASPDSPWSVTDTLTVPGAQNPASITLSASCTTPADITVSGLSASYGDSSGSAQTVTCGAAPQPFTVTGTISSDQAASVSYTFSSGSSGTVSIGAGASIRVTDTVDPPPVTSPDSPWSVTDTLTAMAPGSSPGPASITLSASCTTPADITVSGLSASYGSAQTVTCGATPQPFTVTGTISSSQAASVSYTFSSGSSGTVSIGAGASVRVTDTVDPPPVTSPDSPWSVTDTLTAKAPGSSPGSASITLSASCVYLQ